MKIILKEFLKGMLVGLLFLPLEIALFSIQVEPVKAQEDLRDTIRSQITDPRDSRDRPCEDDPRKSCARPIPTHRPSPEPTGSPQPSESPGPSVQPSPSPSPTNGTGGNGGDDGNGGDGGDEGNGGDNGNGGEGAPQVLGLSFTSSSKMVK